MTKKIIIAIVAVFVALQVMDFVIHGVLMADLYGNSASLWRPEAEMKMGLMMVVAAVSVSMMVLVFALYFKEKTIKTGLIYGILFGIGVGISMGYGTYSVMPIPYHVAMGWFLATVSECAVAGLIMGAILKD